MNRTKIESARNPDGTQGYTWNPITGCLNHDNGLCKGGDFPCYAYKLACGRLKTHYRRNFEIALPHENPKIAFNDPFYPRFWEEKLKGLKARNDRLHYDGAKRHYQVQPRGIFVCDMADLFGVGVPEEWTQKVLDEIWGNKGFDRFYLLTKRPQNLIKWSPFPDNAWVGVTATNQESYYDGVSNITKVEAKVKFVSFEPLLERINGGECAEERRLDSIDEFDWLIIGACTGTREEMFRLCNLSDGNSELLPKPFNNKWTAQPKIEWVNEIVEAADRAGIKVFLKDNLESLLPLDGLFYTHVETNG
ncbi:DUF5131 family protein, partial [Candidatus Magnetobacterium casense]